MSQSDLGLKRGMQFERLKDKAAVKVMCVADGYAMVRRPGCYPFIVTEKDLKDEHKWMSLW